MQNLHTGLLVFFITLKWLKWLFSQVTLEDTPAPYFDPHFVILILMKDSFKKGGDVRLQAKLGQECNGMDRGR